MLAPSEVAWLAAMATALVVLIAVLWLAPPVGKALLSRDAVDPWPAWQGAFLPEPTEQARYLLALTAPILLAGLTIAGVQRRIAMRAQTATVLVVVAQAAGLAFVVACYAAQRAHGFGELYAAAEGTIFHRSYFSPVSVASAALLAAGVLWAVRSETVRCRAAKWLRETRPKAVAAGLLTFAFVALWLLHAFSTEATIGGADYSVPYHLQFTLDETFAVLNGRSPLVDFTAQYGSLWPYGLALGMSAFGETLGTYVTLSLIVTGAAMFGVFAVLRRVTRSSVAALLLFAPVLASAFFVLHGPLDNRYSFANYFGAYPLRYAGPLILLWLLARHLDGARPRQPWLVFLAAGIVVLNNSDGGVPALGGTVAALLWAGGRPTLASLGRLAAHAAAGLLAAFALVSVLTLVRAGALPDPSLLFRYARLFARSGFGLLPMPALGFHLVVYVTFVAAIGVATVRALSAEQDRLMTGLLAWCGVFGLGAGSYYVGRSHPESLIATFGPWALTLALLLVVVLRNRAANPTGRPSIAEVMVAFGFGLTVCSLAQTPLPWQQLERISRTDRPPFAEPYGQSFVAKHTEPGEHAVILMALGHRIGANVDVENVTPYTGSLSMPLPEQLDEAIELMREEGGSKVFFSNADTDPAIPQALSQAGFTRRAADREGGFELWAEGPATQSPTTRGGP